MVDRYNLRNRHRDARNFPVAFYEAYQAAAPAENRFDSLVDLFPVFRIDSRFIHALVPEQFGQGNDRRHGVHDLVCQNPDQFLPGFRLFVFQDGTDVFHADDRKRLAQDDE